MSFVLQLQIVPNMDFSKLSKEFAFLLNVSDIFFIFYSYTIILGWVTIRTQKQRFVLSIRMMKELPTFII